MTTTPSAWADYPGYRIDMIPLVGVGRVEAAGALIAESSRCVIVREADHLDQLYFPIDDIRVRLTPSAHHTTCPFKGVADYWSLATADAELDNVAWGYPNPFDEVAGIAGYVAFYADRVHVTANVGFGDGTEAVTRFPCWGTVADLIAVMNPSESENERQPDDRQPDDHPLQNRLVGTTTTSRYRTAIFPNPRLGTFFEGARKLRSRNVVEGGQQLGAVIAAAGRACPDVPIAWATIVFAKAAHWDTPLDVELELRHRGRSVTATDARVIQDGVLRATASVMGVAGSADVIRHAAGMPDVPGPADCPSHDFGVIGRDFRVVDGAYQHQHVAGPPVLYVWSRFAWNPGERWLHQAAVTQSATHWSVAAALRPSPEITEADAHVTISTGPLAVAIAFHDDLDVTEWLLTETRSIYAGHGSSQSQTRTFSIDGRLVASSTVQAMIRPFTVAPASMGHDASTAM